VCHLLDYRVSLRISRKMSEIFKNQVKCQSLAQLAQHNPGTAKPLAELQQDLARLFEALKTTVVLGGLL
jgi:hypothetical protein